MVMNIAIVVLVVLGVLALAWLVSRRMGARTAAKRIQREKLASVADGHREMADAHAVSVEDLAPQAARHREAAADHTRIAEELEDRIERERRHAQFHAERASETEQEREHI
jgi:biopolymer transport protein ExbB/TolQ